MTHGIKFFCRLAAVSVEGWLTAAVFNLECKLRHIAYTYWMLGFTCVLIGLLFCKLDVLVN